MPTIAADAIDWIDSHPSATPTQKAALVEQVPAHQWALDGGFWPDLSKHCCNRVEIHQEPRFMNRLSINVMTPLPRCLYRSPDGRGLAWLKSGGEITAYGLCEKANCERTKPSPVTPSTMG